MPVDTRPILYSFRRCPYAIRARMAIAAAGKAVELREVVLRNKPSAMLDISPKGTVPVLLCSSGQVIEESIEIMHWALAQHDPHRWLTGNSESRFRIDTCDKDFKAWLDKYKYADRHPEYPHEWYRERAEHFVQELESRLNVSAYLGGETASIEDVAIFPFIRQFAGVDPRWWESSDYRRTRAWLNQWLSSALFQRVMQKYPPWQPDSAAASEPIIFPPSTT